MTQQTRRVKFRKNVDIGSIAAENDKFLEKCFLDTGNLANLADMKDPKRILLGRTGTGKTAVIRELKRKKWNIVTIDPEALSLQYLSNSTILNYLHQLGVHLDLFYKLLWKHIFVVELLKCHYKLEDAESQKRFLSNIFNRLGGNKKKLMAIKYLVQWTDSFFEDTEYRVKEITEKLERRVSSEVGVDVRGFVAKGGDAENASVEQKTDILNKAQSAVNSIQITELNDLVNLMETDIFTDEQKRYFLLIDDLDKDWVDQSIVYDLIKALIDTVNDFGHKIKHIKVVVALRENILQRVLRSQGKRGPQREKYDPLYLELFWTPEELTQLLDLRINELFTDQYSSTQLVSHSDILPPKTKHREDGLKYILDRTFLRPRDLIHFFNICLKNSIDKTTITWDAIKVAELEYSQSRLDSIFDEWKENYPYLDRAFLIFKKFESPFAFKTITDEMVYELVQDFFDVPRKDARTISWIDSIIETYLNSGESALPSIRLQIFNVVYSTGFLGLKTNKQGGPKYSFLPHGDLLPEEIHPDMTLHIHPAFHRALNIRPSK